MNGKRFPNKFFSIVALLSFSLFVLLTDDLSLIANVCFYLYFGIIFVNYLSTKNLSLDIIWLVGFIFIILSELIVTNGGYNVLIVTRYIIVGNNVLLIAYYCSRTKKYYLVHDYRLNNKTWYVALCLVSTIIFFIVVLPSASLAWHYGRAYSDASGGEFVYVVSNFAFVLPGLWAFFYREKRGGFLIAFILSLPFFALLFMQGTRFKLLFSILSFAIGSGKLKLYCVKIRDLVVYAFVGVILMVTLNMMLSIRVYGANSVEDDTSLITKSIDNKSQLPAKIVSYGSIEGIIHANTWLFDYCNKNGYSYGKQSSFIFYWWIPRKIWKNKPSMTGGWLPHMYGNFSEGHSASVGVWGELYVDFGYFSFLFFLLLGNLLAKLDSYCKYLLTEKRNNVNILNVAIFVPYVFFSVRSPITSFITLSISLLFMYIFRYLLFERVG